ncbi:MAG: aminotransferase class I/II-fold pyridoxal phosphate-dependent enzyme [Nocardioidaceae bacterium]|nr:aminotransferase class I/II-fold pyridoxal phosphate-dependent enzyme [Nocardioidaceae bacterium]NUS49732.1 aminotransferase class I/II-fold pyridoxal phosphate-dependent enzyme [Nocardioidaceae bacterium]
MPDTPDFDGTIDRLRTAGGLKWTLHPAAIGAFVAEMDFGTAEPVVRALHESVESGLFGYLPPRLVDELARAWTGFARDRYGWDVPPERVRPLADVVSGLVVAIDHFSRPGRPVILPTPAYMPFLVVPRELGRDIIQVPMARDGDRYVYDLDALDAAYRAGGDLLVLCNPHNPIGRVLEPDEMTAVAEVVDRHGGRVFSDEIHAPLVYDGLRHVPYATLSDVTAAHTVTAVSASKAWNLPGLKCAQLVLSNDADAELWARVGTTPEHGASNPGVVANIAAYTQGGPWLDAVLAHLDGSRRLLGDLLAAHLPEVRYRAPEGTYLAWLDCRDLGLGDHPGEFFLEHAGVALTDGPACGDAGAGFARYNFATPRAVMEQTVARMGEAVHRHRG